ncbi:MAG TPA: CarD family transcriptional regulator [Pyrinomonadaceae bacterium]|nr:CarD family transcriptional regulator [Pyrinomonadaceae bacterium]
MKLEIGQKVCYPGQGVCSVESRTERKIGETKISGFYLRVVSDKSSIFVPESNIDSVGIRPVISGSQCKRLITRLAEDFESASSDWKSRSREFMLKLQSGDIFAAADVLKKLTYLSREKRLSFREQTLLEKAKFLIVSEITNSSSQDLATCESQVVARVEKACAKHSAAQPHAAAAG